MQSTGKVVAWACMFTTLFMGCYNSVLIDPKGEGKKEIRSNKIKYLVTTNGTKYVFDYPPTIVNDAVVIGPTEKDKIYSDHIEYVATQDGTKWEFNSFLTIVNDTIVTKPTEKYRIYSNRIDYVVTEDGTKYEFDKAPAIVDDAIVGEAKVRTDPGFITKQVSIPLSDVVRVNVKELDSGKTIESVLLVLGAVGLIICLLAPPSGPDFPSLKLGIVK